MAKVLLHPDEQKTVRCVNRRSYPRVPYKVPLCFSVCSHNTLQELQDGFSENLSQTGMLLALDVVLPLSSLIILDLNVDMLEHCINMEYLYMTEYKSLIAKVMNVRHNKTKGYYSVGISFIKADESKRNDVKKALKCIPQV
jgi:c-di-GMP-binding flagellar brake protein YcgR